MNVSTAVELVGFAAFDAAAWSFGARAGLVGTGALLLFIGYALEDDKAIVALHRMTAIMKRIRKRKEATP